MRRGGQLSLVGLVAGATAQIDIMPLVTRNIRVQGIFVGGRDQLKAVTRALILHRIELLIDLVYRFDQAGEAIAALGWGEPPPRLVIQEDGDGGPLYDAVLLAIDAIKS